ncbi:MAG: RluA family pseudouridine synthase [Alphaproteobacteria bacterium]|nr:RluA family pseudouridine synthase [Alphaproteobacteria bacterium]
MPDLPTVAADYAQMRLERYLRQQFPKLTLGAINRALRQRQVRLNNKRVKGDARIHSGDIVCVPKFFLERPTDDGALCAPRVDLRLRRKLANMVVAVTPEYFVLNKPQGLAVQGGSGTRWHLDRMLPSFAALYDDPPDHLRIVHRLDKETSGLLLVARGRQAAQRLARQFQQHRIRKYYVALCHGVPEPETGCIDAALGKCPDRRFRPEADATRPAQSDYQVFDSVAGLAATVLLSPITGRTHQLRAHLALIGCPILGDDFYGAEANNFVSESPLCLHAMGLIVPPHKDKPHQDYFQTPPVWLYSHARQLGLILPTQRQLWASLVGTPRFGVS